MPTWNVRRHRRKTMVRGRWIRYSPQAIDDLLENPYRRQEEQCHYQRLCGKKKGFSNRKVATVLCMLRKGYQLTEASKETCIRRRDMRTLAQVWLTFMLANVMPTGHVSDINVTKSNLLFSMMQDDFTINIAKVISDEIQKVIDEERVRRGERRGTLEFRALITALCESQGVFLDPKVKIRSPIDLKFIQLHCTNAEEYPSQRNRAPSPPKSPSSPTLEAIEKRIVRHVFHMEDQQSVICRFMMQMYHAMRDKTFMNDEELSSYLNWPGDRPSLVEGAENEGDEVQSDTGNKEAPVDNEAEVDNEPLVAPATEEPAVSSHADNQLNQQLNHQLIYH